MGITKLFKERLIRNFIKHRNGDIGGKELAALLRLTGVEFNDRSYSHFRELAGFGKRKMKHHRSSPERVLSIWSDWVGYIRQFSEKDGLKAEIINGMNPLVVPKGFQPHTIDKRRLNPIKKHPYIPPPTPVFKPYTLPPPPIDWPAARQAANPSTASVELMGLPLELLIGEIHRRKQEAEKVLAAIKKAGV